MNYENVASELFKRIPEYETFYRREADYMGDDTLNYVVFGGILVEFIAKLLASLDTQDRAFDDPEGILSQIFGVIEKCATSKVRDVRLLIEVGFLEVLYTAGDYYEAIVERLDPASKQLLQKLK
jgi:hypothetical protein